ncbi:putative extracellular dihydrogeodin oxidase/laccase [Xylariaceae sp. FL0255]|nr:putative extracellular dihydrogeodin oxidase/laccase [Xylariaceae sp. FL0255]
MHILKASAFAGAALSSLVGARATKGPCENSAANRSCWGNYNISTNYYDTIPNTGVTREYWLDIQNKTIAPDGRDRIGLVINGSIPGPTIIADWGDNVVVHVTNSLQDNGTSIHWHGIRQLNNNAYDGVSSVTQCPIAPGQSTTYRWRAEEYGSSWYHAHWYVQAWDGVFGGILINGPASGNYDEDLGNLFLNDWDINTADSLLVGPATTGRPTLQNGLINGTNTYTNNVTGVTTGSRHSNTVTAGTRYRIRLVNAGQDVVFKFSIDNHPFEVIAADFVPIVPYTTDTVSLTMGQRYDIIVTANQTVGNYWMRATAQLACTANDNPEGILGIWNYEDVDLAEPTSTSWANINDSDTCEDEAMSDLVPVVAMDVGAKFYNETTFDAGIYPNTTLVEWNMGPTPYLNLWSYPTLLQVLDHNNTWVAEQNIQAFPEANTWGVFIVQTTKSVAHPIHMHGHDFYVLAQGSGPYDASNTTLQMTNPPRRDTVLLPASGHVVIAFYTDNPGAWLMHCHVAWHASEGFAVQILERESEIPGTVTDKRYVTDTCSAWAESEKVDYIPQLDSGI